MTKHSHPSNLELQALSVLWHDGPSTVYELLEALPDGRDRAYTTVLSVMQSLERKNLVRSSRAGRSYVYEATESREAIMDRAIGDFLTNAFGGRLGEAILALLSAGTLTPEEKTRIKRELQRHKTMAAKKTAKKAAKKVAKKVAKKAPAKKAAKKVAKKAAKKAPAKKAAKKVVKKAAKKVAKSAKKPAKKAAKKAVAKKAPAKKAAKKVVKKAAKKAPAKKVAKKAAKKVAKKAAKKAAKKK